MKCLMSLLFLVLFCSVLVSGMRVEPQRCCFSFMDRPLPIKSLVDYSMTSQQCPKEAVLFKTIKGHQLCANPADLWVQKHMKTIDSKLSMESDPIEVAALGRSLFPGMLYDCRKDFFIAGVTLWDKKSLSENLDTRPQPQTDLKFISEDSLSSKSLHMDVSASLKASFLAGMVEVEGSAKYLHDTKSSNHQSRVTMFYRETTRFEQLTMTQLGNITYPQVFDQKTATHVVTSVLYGAQAVMVFDWTFSENDNETKIGGDLNVMVRNIPDFSINGKGSLNMTESDKKKAEHIACTFYGDVLLKNNPTTYMEALETYKLLPALLKENNQSVVPVKVTLYPLHRLNKKAAQLVREISTNLVSNIEDIMEALEKTKRTCNDLLRNTLVNVFSDLKERLLSFQESLSNYKTMLQEAVSRVLPAIRGNETTKEKSLEDILKIHYDSDFNADKLNQWLADAKSELSILSFQTMVLDNTKIEDSDGLNTILLNPNIDAVVCLTFTSLNYEDKYLSALKGFLKSDKFKDVDQNKILFSGASFRKWFTDPDVIKMMRDNLSHFRGFSEANKDEKRISFIISVISNSNINGSSIYLYEQGKLTDTQFQPVSKPAPPIVKDAQHDKVYLQLKKSPTGETVSYRVEYKQEGAAEWLVIDTTDEGYILNGLEYGSHYLICYRIVGKVGVSEASDTVKAMPQ